MQLREHFFPSCNIYRAPTSHQTLRPAVGSRIQRVLSLLEPGFWARFAVLCLVAQSCPTLCDPMGCRLPGSSVLGDSPGKNTGVGCHALLWGVFPTQGLNPGLLHCRHILYHLNHQRSPRILEWAAYPFSTGFS